MVQIILEDKYLIRDHMNGFLVSEVKPGLLPFVIKRDSKSGTSYDYSNFGSESYHPDFPAVAKKICALERNSIKLITDLEKLAELYAKTDERIANIEKYFNK